MKENNFKKILMLTKDRKIKKPWSISIKDVKKINGIKKLIFLKKEIEFSSHKFNLIYGHNGVGKSSFAKGLSSLFIKLNSNKKIEIYKYIKKPNLENIENKTKFEKNSDYKEENNDLIKFVIKDSSGKEKEVTGVKKEQKILLYFYTSDPYAISKKQSIIKKGKKITKLQSWTTRGWENSFNLGKISYFKIWKKLVDFQQKKIQKKITTIDFNIAIFTSTRKKTSTKKARTVEINNFFNSVLIIFFEELEKFLKEMLKLSNISFDQKYFQKEKNFSKIMKKFSEIKNKAKIWIISNLKTETKRERNYYKSLSEGEQNLLGLIITLYNVGASLIFNFPVLLVLDEPLICLDFLRYQKVLGFLKFLKTVDKNDNLNIILFTHSEKFLKAIFWNFTNQNNLFLMTKNEEKIQIIQKIKSEDIFSGELCFFYEKIWKFEKKAQKEKLQIHYLILSSSFISETLKIIYKKTTKWDQSHLIKDGIKLKIQEYKNLVDVFLLHSVGNLYQEDKKIRKILEKNKIEINYSKILKLILTSNSFFAKKILGKVFFPKTTNENINLIKIEDFYKKIILEQRKILPIILNSNSSLEKESFIDHNLYYISLALSIRVIIEFFLKGCNVTKIGISNHEESLEELIKKSFSEKKIINFQELRMFKEFEHFLNIHSHFFPIGENSPIEEHHQHSYKNFFKKYLNWLEENEKKIFKFL